MVTNDGYRYYKSCVSIHALFVGAAWVGIWLLWPKNGSTEWSFRRLAHTKFVYIGEIECPTPSRDPDLVFMMSPKSRETKGSEEFPKLQGFPSGRTHFLERRGLFYPDSGGAKRASLPMLAANSIIKYEPVWSRTESYLMLGPEQPLLHVMTSPRLDECGFSLPSEFFNDKPNIEDSWNATLHIKIGAEGKPHHVFLLVPSEYPAVNAWLIRTVSQVGCVNVEAHCKGWITIEYGGR